MKFKKPVVDSVCPVELVVSMSKLGLGLGLGLGTPNDKLEYICEKKLM